MNEILVRERHFVALLTEEEMTEINVQAAKSRMTIKDWISMVIREKLEKIKEET